jgi:AcrR family transcriptional regulator
MTRTMPVGSPRQARSIRNDARILAAAEGVLVEQGWSALSIRAVARAGGVSERMVRDRVQDASELAVTLWHERLSDSLTDALLRVLQAFGLAPTVGRAPVPVAGAFTPFLRPAPGLQAAMELLLAERHHPSLAAAVAEAFVPKLCEWIGWSRDHERASQAAQRAMVIARALGLLAFAGFDDSKPEAFLPFEEELARAFRRPAAPLPLPRVRAAHLDRLFPFETGDAVHDALLEACMRTVGEIGFDRAMLTTIVERAGVDINFAYRHHKRKLDLFTDATRRQRLPSLEMNRAFGRRNVERYGHGVAEALLMREFQRPGREVQRNVDVEQLRLARHDSALRLEVIAEGESLEEQMAVANPQVERSVLRAAVMTGRATGIGVIMLPRFYESVWRLPYRVITEAIYAS